MLQLNNTIKELQLRIALYEDMKAYKELYFLLFKGLQRFSCSYVKSPEIAEEIVSDVFIKLWQIRNQLSEINNLKVYLYCITKNLSLNFITKKNRHPVVCLDQTNTESFIEIKTPEDLYISNEIINSVKQAVSELPEQCRTIFLLVREHGLKYKEVARILDISFLTVRNQVAIATKKIAEALPVNSPYSVHFQSNFSAS
jgi:RNA polymerase sigma-70 factor (family 1)